MSVVINLKNSFLFKGFTNIFIRAVILSLKFAFSIILVKLISLESYGEYSLFVASVTLGGFLFSWDYYFYSSRKINSTSNKKEKKKIIINQLQFHVIFYFLVSPFFILLFLYDFISIQYVIVFFFILFSDNIAQELFRLLIASGKSINANIVFAIKTTPYVIVVVGLAFLDYSELIDLRLIFYLMLISTSTAIFVGLRFLKISIKEILVQHINKTIIYSALKISIVFFISTLSFKLIEFLGRFALDYKIGKDATGVFTFFFAVTNLCFIITQAGVFHLFGPKLIKSYQLIKQNKHSIFRDLYKKFIYITFTSSVLIITFLIILLPFLMEFLNKPSLSQNIEVFYVLVLGNFFFTISFIPHYYIYTYRQDKLIMHSMLMALTLFLIVLFPMINTYGITGAAISTTLAFIMIFIGKLVLALKLSKKIKFDAK